MIHAFRKIVKITGSGGRFLLLLALRAPFDIALTITNATFLQHVFRAVEQGDAAGLYAACRIYALASLCLFLYNGTAWGLYAPFCTRMEGRLRIRLYEKITSFRYERIEATSHGEWLTRLNADVEMPFARGFHLPQGACAMVNISVSAIILYRLDPAVFGWVILFVVPHITFNQFIITRIIQGLNKKSLEATASNTGELTALIACADIAALYDGHGYLMTRFEKSSLDLLRANMKQRARNALAAGIRPLFELGGYLTLLIFASGRIADGSIAFGDLTAAFQYRGGVLVGSLILISSLTTIRAGMAGMKRLQETIQERSDEPIRRT